MNDHDLLIAAAESTAITHGNSLGYIPSGMMALSIRKCIYEKTQPLIDFYKEEGCLVDIDGTKAPDEVFKDITRAIGV